MYKKKQIETMILHMTDGIIAFNMQGEVILVNPAATRLLRLLPLRRQSKPLMMLIQESTLAEAV